MGFDDIYFVIEWIIESYVVLFDWKFLDFWFLELQVFCVRYAGKSFLGFLIVVGNEMNVIWVLVCFDEGDIQGVWVCFDLTFKISVESLFNLKLVL